MKKVNSLIFVLFFTLFSLNAAEWNIYSNADKKTLSKIEKCDTHIKNGKYLSAYSEVSGCENEYIIYKYIEVCTQYYAQSIMHTMFAFVNLEKGQTLLDVRTKGTDFSMVMNKTPEEIISEYKKNKGDSLVLQLALVNYYYDAIKRYQNQWLKTPDEVMPLVINTYEAAVKKDVYDEQILSNLAEIYTGRKDFTKAEGIFEKLTQKVQNNGSYWYNYTVCLMQNQKYEKAISTAQKAVDNPEENPLFHYDAYMILADAYTWCGNGKDADKVLRQAIKKYPNQAGAYTHLAELYFFFPSDYTKKDLETFLDKAVKVEPTGKVVNSCVMLLCSNQLMQDAMNFCERNLLVVKDNDAKGLMNYYLAQFYVMLQGDYAKAKTALNKARENFVKAGNTAMVNECDSVKKDMLGE